MAMSKIDIASHEPFTEVSRNGNRVSESNLPGSMSMSTIVVMTPLCLPRSDSLSAGSRRKKKVGVSSLPQLVPQEQCTNVSSCATLVLAKPKPKIVGVMTCFTVWLHIYDLSKGFVIRNSKSLTGVHVDGLYHSGIVCYGLEFFFEGGIGVTAAGCTRFGKVYETVSVGSTTKSLGELLAWMRSREETEFNLSGYHPTEHNCHHFTNSAAEFLTGRTNPAPARLFDTVSDIIATDVGKGLTELMVRVIRGVQYAIAHKQRDRCVERIRAELNVLECARSAGVKARPPVCVVFFRVDSPKRSRAALEAIAPYAELLTHRGVIPEPLSVSLRTFALTVSQGAEALHPRIVGVFVDTIVSVLANTPRTLWGPVLNALRIAVLHKTVLAVCVFHPVLLGLLASGARDFFGMTLDGKIALLRVLCNFSSGQHGAAALNSPRFARFWISVAGLAIADCRNTAIVYTGAALALNMAHAIVLTTQPSLSLVFSEGSGASNTAARSLVTLLLFSLRQWPGLHSPEAAINMQLLALFVIAASCPQAAAAVLVDHPIRLPFDALIRNVKTRESKHLLCLLRSLAAT